MAASGRAMRGTCEPCDPKSYQESVRTDRGIIDVMPTRATGKERIENAIQLLIDRAHLFFERTQWDIDVAGLSTLRAGGVKVTRILSLAWQGMVQNDCLTRASALTYVTVLSLVPLLAFGFSVAKGLGAYEYLRTNTITPALEQLAPAGSAGAQEVRTAIESVLGFVERTNFANLGLVGLAFLVLAALKLMTDIEGSFNVIWGVKQARSLIRKVTDFVALVVVTPILLLGATAVAAALQNNAATTFLSETLQLGSVVQVLFRLSTMVAVWLGFCFLYMIMPNTRVPFVSAILGGIVAGTIWQVVQVLHIQLQVGVANYNAIYAGFAALPIFLVWVYMNWVAVLLGALVAWAHQVGPTYREHKRMCLNSLADRELVALRALSWIAAAFAEDRGAVPVGTVASRSNLPPAVLQEILQPLITHGLIARTDDDQTPGFLPARPLDDIRIHDALAALRGRLDESVDSGDGMSQTLERLHTSLATSPHNLTLRQLVDVEADPERK